jgi:hypothetical protein
MPATADKLFPFLSEQDHETVLRLAKQEIGTSTYSNCPRVASSEDEVPPKVISSEQYVDLGEPVGSITYFWCEGQFDTPEKLLICEYVDKQFANYKKPSQPHCVDQEDTQDPWARGWDDGISVAMESEKAWKLFDIDSDDEEPPTTFDLLKQAEVELEDKQNARKRAIVLGEFDTIDESAIRFLEGKVDCLYVIFRNRVNVNMLEVLESFQIHTELSRRCEGQWNGLVFKPSKKTTKEELQIFIKEAYVAVHDSKLKNEQQKKDQPQELFNVPGFVNEFIELSMATAPYPNRPLAFCGAMAMLSLLLARKITFNGLAPNVYLLGLAYSGSGKDHPRKIINQLAGLANLNQQLGNSFASGEGIEDSLWQSNSMLFLPDEFNHLILNMANQKEARFTSINEKLLTLFTSSTTTFFCRRRAGKDEPQRVIHRPHLSLFATCTPGAFYESLSARMMTSGLMARLLVVDAGSRGARQRNRPIVPSESMLMKMQHYLKLPFGEGNLAEVTPQPQELPSTEAAMMALDSIGDYADEKYNECFASQDEGGMAVWARCFEHVAKLAMLYSASAKPQEMEVTADAVQWAGNFVNSQIQRMLKAVSEGLHESPFDALVGRLRKKIANTKGGISHSDLLKFARVSRKDFALAIETLAERGEIESVLPGAADSGKRGPKGRLYILARQN